VYKFRDIFGVFYTDSEGSSALRSHFMYTWSQKLRPWIKIYKFWTFVWEFW